MQNEVRVTLTVTSYPGDPDEITKATNLTPKRAWRPGDSIGGSIRRYAYNGWKFAAPVGKEVGLGRQIEILLDSLGESFAYFRDLDSRCDLEISCAVYARESTPEMQLSRKALRGIADLGAEIDIDFYYLVPQQGRSGGPPKGSLEDRILSLPSLENACRVSLVLAELKEDPDEISRATNLSPRLVWRPADRMERRSIRRGDSGWVYAGSGDEDEDLDRQIERMLSSLGESFDTFAAMSDRCAMEVSCVVVRASGSVPMMNFPSELVRRMADLGASLGIDYYDLTESDQE